ncbi:MAG: iron-containing alcohol dehydrogenase [Gammaproteobacteria bacterium]|nr:iron-containing alcohol dehydrogenase [Gammaproteobacteria bacterium]
MPNASYFGNWNYPTAIRFGTGRIKELPTIARQQYIHHPLLVTDQGLVRLPIFALVCGILNDAKISYTVYSDIKPNPTGKNVEDGVNAYHQAKCDGIIALGGGSALDAAKAIALMVGQKRSLWDFEDVGDNWTLVNAEGIARCIAIPTTAGTGSEVGRASVITSEVEHRKVIIFHPLMLPPVVIADPELTLNLPPHVTAATGMDALSHCLEAYCAPTFHPIADGIAMEGMRLVKEWLVVAHHEPHNIAARAHMLVASTMGATAFQKGLGAMHALAHPLGAHYDAHHGLLNAILMPYVLVANAPAIEEKMTRLAAFLGIKGKGTSVIIRWVEELRLQLKIPHTLKEIGIDSDGAEQIASAAVHDPSAGGNPISFDHDQYRALFLHALTGTRK